MKRYLFGILVSAVLVPLAGLAVGMNNVTPVQSFQQADSQPSVQQKSLAQTLASSQAAIDSTKNTSVSLSSTAASSINKNNAPLDHQSAAMLQAELTQLNQNNLQFQQKAEERIIALNDKNQQLQHRLQILEQAMTLLNQELIQLKQVGNTANQLQQSTATEKTGLLVNFRQWFVRLHQVLGPTGYNVAMGAAIVVLLLLLWALWPRRKKSATNRSHFDAHPKVGDVLDDTKEEYDYMGSAESMPAKINLARTYIAMEDYDAARKVLKEVNKHGDPKQQLEADELINELPAES